MIKYGVDKNGYIATKVNLNKIKPLFYKVLDKIKNEVIDKFGGKIHSLYLYGSVATGKARIKSSDLDLLLVLRQKPTPKIKNNIKTVLETLKSTHETKKVRSICGSIMRKIVRTGFSLVMEQDHSWTTDLKKSCELFSKYYPEQSINIEKAFSLTQNPTANTKELEKFLKDFGNWLSKEVEKKL